jgi:hypothetical protein
MQQICQDFVSVTLRPPLRRGEFKIGQRIGGMNQGGQSRQHVFF